MKKIRVYLTYLAMFIIFVGCNENDTLSTQNQSEFALTHSYYQDENGTMQLSAEYTYDEYGNLLTMQDYIFKRSIEKTYDQNQSLLSEKTIVYGGITIVSYTYNEQGQILSETWDINSSGHWYWKEIYTYNEAGNVVSLDYDTYADGIVNAVKYFTYDMHNNMLTRGWDYDLDGEVEHYEIINTFDEFGNILSSIQRYELDIGSNTTSTYYYYNEDNLLIKEEIDNNSDENIDRTKYYTYNMQGKLIFVKDEYVDGMQSKEIKYNSHGNIIAEKLRYFYLEHLDINTSYAYDYDAYGNIISSTCSGSCDQFEKYKEFTWKN